MDRCAARRGGGAIAAPAIQVEQLGKRYLLGERPPLGGLLSRGSREELWALRDVDLVVEQGEVKGLLESGVLEWEITVDRLTDAEAERLRGEGHTVETTGHGRVVRVREADALQQVLRAFARDEVFIHAVEPRRPSLEEHFVRTIQSDERGAA